LGVPNWDTEGQEKFRSLIPSYIRNSIVVILVYDITSSESFEGLEPCHKLVLDIVNLVLVVAGNKVDLEAHRQISKEEGEKYAEIHSAGFYETSARCGVNINELLSAVGHIPLLSPAQTGTSPVLDARVRTENKGGSCC
jgi:small GTP-binding protein